MKLKKEKDLNMSLGQFAAYFDFLSTEYLRLVAEASFHCLHGNHGNLL
jgi:hypothetical protein